MKKLIFFILLSVGLSFNKVQGQPNLACQGDACGVMQAAQLPPPPGMRVNIRFKNSSPTRRVKVSFQVYFGGCGGGAERILQPNETWLYPFQFAVCPPYTANFIDPAPSPQRPITTSPPPPPPIRRHVISDGTYRIKSVTNGLYFCRRDTFDTMVFKKIDSPLDETAKWVIKVRDVVDYAHESEGTLEGYNISTKKRGFYLHFNVPETATTSADIRAFSDFTFDNTIKDSELQDITLLWDIEKLPNGNYRIKWHKHQYFLKLTVVGTTQVVDCYQIIGNDPNAEFILDRCE